MGRVGTGVGLDWGCTGSGTGLDWGRAGAGLGLGTGAEGFPSSLACRVSRGKELGFRPSFSLPPLRELCLARRLTGRQGSSCYSPETERGWPGGGGRVACHVGGGSPPCPLQRLQPKPACSCCPPSLWPLGRTLRAAA